MRPVAGEQVIGLIAARGGSKGVPGKNLVPLCGRPLLAWSIEQALAAGPIDAVWVTSDDDEILRVAAEHGAETVQRPAELSTDTSSSEVAWLHALDEIERRGTRPGLVCALQATSPLREPRDIERGVEDFARQGCDSLFSAAELRDFLVWRRGERGLESVNYDFNDRGRRQDRVPWYAENGSFYLFPPQLLREQDNRLAGDIGVTIMEFWKTFEIDTHEDISLCELLMRRYLLESA